MGSAEFGLPAFEMLLDRHDVAAVVSTPAKPKGRGLKLFDSPVTEFAKSRGIDTVLTPENLQDPEFITALKSMQADLFVVVAFRILPADVYTIPRLGTVNIHASLLPRYRGAAPIHRAIEAGESETGVTVFRIDEGVDTGEVILQRKISINGNETTPELYERLSVMGADVLREAVDGLESGSASASVQNQSEATRAPKLTRQEGHIDWKLPSTKIFNKIRAFKPFPGTYFFINGKRMNAEWAEVVDTNVCRGDHPRSPAAPDNDTVNPGTVLTAKGDFIDVQCGNGVLRITKIKPEGRPAMDVRAFLLGHSVAEGTVLG